MRYDYRCNDCEAVWEEKHSIHESPKIVCPNCNGDKTEVAFLSVPITYIKGYGWLDKRGRRRDMNLYKLMNDDPYGGMRQPGEKEELANNLRKGGKRNKNSKIFSGRSKKKKKS